jgi:hypothetical protein
MEEIIMNPDFYKTFYITKDCKLQVRFEGEENWTTYDSTLVIPEIIEGFEVEGYFFRADEISNIVDLCLSVRDCDEAMRIAEKEIMNTSYKDQLEILHNLSVIKKSNLNKRILSNKIKIAKDEIIQNICSCGLYLENEVKIELEDLINKELKKKIQSQK